MKLSIQIEPIIARGKHCERCNAKLLKGEYAVFVRGRGYADSGIKRWHLPCLTQKLQEEEHEVINQLNAEARKWEEKHGNPSRVVH